MMNKRLKKTISKLINIAKDKKVKLKAPSKSKFKKLKPSLGK